MYRFMCVEFDICPKLRNGVLTREFRFIDVCALTDPSRFHLVHPNQHGTPILTHIASHRRSVTTMAKIRLKCRGRSGRDWWCVTTFIDINTGHKEAIGLLGSSAALISTLKKTMKKKHHITNKNMTVHTCPNVNSLWFYSIQLIN